MRGRDMGFLQYVRAVCTLTLLGAFHSIAVSPPRYLGKNTGQGTTTCFGHFQMPCAVQSMSFLVDTVSRNLVELDPEEVLRNVSSKQYNQIIDLWPNVITEEGKYLASGLERTTGGEEINSNLPDGRGMVGLGVEEHAQIETGFSQGGLWERMQAAAEDDGHFEFVGWDNFHLLDGTGPHAVARVGYCRWVNTSLGRLLVSAAVSDMPFVDMFRDFPCDAEYDGVCSVSTAQRIVGQIVVRAIKAATPAQLQDLWAEVTWGEFNEGKFYPFVGSFSDAGDDLGFVARGDRRDFVGGTVDDMQRTLEQEGSGALETNLFEALRDAALDGGKFLSYLWSNAWSGGAFLKVSLVVGVQRWGRNYFMGVGFNHRPSPMAMAPLCAECKADFNYPCAWTNALAVTGHAQTVALVSHRYSMFEVGEKLSNLELDSSSGGFYPFLFDFNGTCVSHILPGAVGTHMSEFVPRVTHGLVDGAELHFKFTEAARKGGGWVRYDWTNTQGRIESKVSYIIQIDRGGRSYYVGSGLHDRRAPVEGCSSAFTAPCSEAAAGAVTGSLIATIVRHTWNMSAQTAELDAELSTMARELQATAEMRTQPDAEPFVAHVQSTDLVLADGADASMVGMSTAEWFSAVGLEHDVLDDLDVLGTWLGPALMSPGGRGVPSPHLLLYTSVTTTVSTYRIIVPVAFAPMPPPASDDACRQVSCSGGQGGNAACAEPDPQQLAYCRCKDEYEPQFTALPVDVPQLEMCAGPRLLLQEEHALTCVGAEAEADSARFVETFLAVGIVLAVVGVMCVWCINRRGGIEPEQRAVCQRVRELRKMLLLRKRDGFRVDGEVGWPGSLHIKTRMLDELARLTLLLDFDARHVDALAAILRYSNYIHAAHSVDASRRTSSSGSSASSYLCSESRQHRALRHVLLETSKHILDPTLADGDGPCGRGVLTWARRSSGRERFDFFVRFVCKLNLWEEGDNLVLLKGVAQLFMDRLHGACDAEYQRVLAEEGGADLTAMAGPADEWAAVLRQDHPMVQAVPVLQRSWFAREVLAWSSQPSSPRLSPSPKHRLRRSEDALPKLSSDTLLQELRISMPSSVPPISEAIDTSGASSAEASQGGGEVSEGQVDDVQVVRGRAPRKWEHRPSNAWLEPSWAEHGGAGEVGGSGGGEGGGGEEMCEVEEMAPMWHKWGNYEKRLQRIGSCVPAPAVGRHVSNEEPFVHWLWRRAELLNCEFQDKVRSLFEGIGVDLPNAGGDSEVSVFPGPIKSKLRMLEKVQAYSEEMDSHAYDPDKMPLAAMILDPVRASIVCNNPKQVGSYARWLVAHGKEHGLPVVRLKNKFSLHDSSEYDGYRDIMLCVVFTGSSGLRIIGEVQLHEHRMHALKVAMHRLYKVKRATSARTI